MKKKVKIQVEQKIFSNPVDENTETNSIFDNLLLFAFLFVHLIPSMSRLDVMGPQWYYLAVIDMIAFVYLSYTRKNILYQVVIIFKQPFAAVYLLFVMWAGCSWFYAINQNEMIVCFARLITTFLAFTNIAILLYEKKNVFISLSYAFMVIAAYESMQVLGKFINSYANENTDELILALTGNAGNKNIIAASIVIKIPFLFYLFDQKGTVKKTLSLLVIFLQLLALFILNARASYVSVAVILIIYISSKIFLRNNKLSLWAYLKPLATILGVLILALGISIYIFKKTVELSGKETAYSNPLKRIVTISASNEGSSGRWSLWSNAIDYLQQHPFIGAGYGNWKLAAIPYEKELTNDYFVSYHVHNDFLEMGAELGLIGICLYVGIFILLIIGFLKKILNHEISSNPKTMMLVGLMSLTAYCVDAFFNFPIERPLIQFNFAITAALFFMIPIQVKKFTPNIHPLYKKLFLILFFFSIYFVLYINGQVDESLKRQVKLAAELERNQSELTSIDFEFPSHPNLAYTTMPIKTLLARYKIKEGKINEALAMLEEADLENPYLHYSSLLRTLIYFNLKNSDSVYKYSKLTFENRPRSKTAYSNWVYSCYTRGDTLELEKAFRKYTKYRDEADAWKSYFTVMILLNKKGDPKLLNLADSAIQKFPDSLTLFTRIKQDLQLPVNSSK